MWRNINFVSPESSTIQLYWTNVLLALSLYYNRDLCLNFTDSVTHTFTCHLSKVKSPISSLRILLLFKSSFPTLHNSLCPRLDIKKQLCLSVCFKLSKTWKFKTNSLNWAWKAIGKQYRSFSDLDTVGEFAVQLVHFCTRWRSWHSSRIAPHRAYYSSQDSV